MPQNNVYKIVLCGSAESGKTALITNAAKDEFSESYQATIGAAFFPLNIGDTKDQTNPKADRLDVWDTAGLIRYKGLVSLYCSDAAAIVLVTDLSLWAESEPSVVQQARQDLTKYIQNIKERGSSLLTFFLVGTKQDIAASKQIEKMAVDNLNAFANDNGIQKEHVFITTSKFTGGNKEHRISREDQFKYPKDLFNTICTELNSQKQAVAQVSKEDGPAVCPSSCDNKSRFGDWSLGPEGRLIALYVGAFLGAVMGLVIHNPVTCFLAAWRTPDWAEWNIPNIFRIFIFAPIVNPLVAACYGAMSGGATGIKGGFSKKLLDIPREMSEPFKLRTIITGSVLSIFIGVAVAVAVIHLLPVALPILLGVAGATALVAGISYEGIDSVLTDNELQKTLKNKSVSKPLLRAEDESSLGLELSSRSSSRHVASSAQQSSMLAVNAYEKAHNAGSWRSWFQVPPATPAASAKIAIDANPHELVVLK